MLNINRGHNRELIRKCRKLEEYTIFIEKIRENIDHKMSVRSAIDYAVEECIKEGILEKILRENREEVCSMLLSEYDEQAHIESEKEIAREEGIKTGIKQGIQKGVEEGITQGENRLALLVEYLQRDGRQQDLGLLSDEKIRRRLYREYNLTNLSAEEFHIENSDLN